MNPEVTSSHYRKSWLIQGELEVECKINIKMHTSFNKAVFSPYKDKVKELYNELMDEEL